MRSRILIFVIAHAAVIGSALAYANLTG